MNIRIIVLILLIIGLKFYSITHAIDIVVQENFFYVENKKIIDKVVNDIMSNCYTKEKTILNLKFDIMPPQLQAINPYENGRTSIFANESWIEINYKYWELNSDNNRSVLLYHEIAHALGIKHNESINNVMNKEAPIDGNIEQYLKSVLKHCQELRTLPTSNTY